MGEPDILLVVLLGLVLLGSLSLVLLLLLRRASVRHASQIRYRPGPRTWSSLALEERIRVGARPKRLPRSHPSIRPSELSEQQRRAKR